MFDELVVCVLKEEMIDDLCAFEVEMRITEPEVWGDGGSDFDVSSYKNGLTALDIDKMSHAKTVVAYLNGRIIARCDIVIQLSLWDLSKAGYIDWIYTLKAQRGLGIGKGFLSW